MKCAWLELALLSSLAIACNASAMTTEDNASRAPASKAVKGANEGRAMPLAGVKGRSAPRAAGEAAQARPRK